LTPRKLKSYAAQPPESESSVGELRKYCTSRCNGVGTEADCAPTRAEGIDPGAHSASHSATTLSTPRRELQLGSSGLRDRSWHTTQERKGKVTAHHNRRRVCGGFPSLLFSLVLRTQCATFYVLAQLASHSIISYPFPNAGHESATLAPTHSWSPSPQPPFPVSRSSSYNGASLMAVLIPCP
jgi:hypothetical protein